MPRAAGGAPYVRETPRDEKVLGPELPEPVLREKGQPRALIVEGLSDKYDEDPETNDRLECRACLKEFPLPKDLPVDYV